MQVMLRRIAERTARSQPEVFARLGEHTAKRFLIDPSDLPLVLLLAPDPLHPRFTAHRRTALPPHEARISATFGTLLKLLDGTLDADAVFFNRELLVTGELEAALSLRNALDDYRGDLVDDALRALGVLHRPAALLLRATRGRT
jgi:predicted lipid carrier protein YhbT